MPVTAVNQSDKIVTKWVRESTWPQGEALESVIIASKVDSSGAILRLHSTFSYFEIDATYHNDTSSLADVQVYLVDPGKAEGTAVAATNLYPVSIKSGEDITFELENGVVRGKVSFQLKNDQHEQHNIYATYHVNLPHVGELEDTINIGPCDLGRWTHTNKGVSKHIVKLPPSEQLDPIKEALSSSETIVIGSPGRAADDDESLLIEFSNNSIEAYHLSPIVWRSFPGDRSKSSLPLWRNCEKNAFLDKLELLGCINSKTHVIFARLYGYAPRAGRLVLANRVEGSLLSPGVPVVINVPAAKGQGSFFLSHRSGKPILSTEIKVKLEQSPEIASAGPQPIFKFH